MEKRFLQLPIVLRPVFQFPCSHTKRYQKKQSCVTTKQPTCLSIHLLLGLFVCGRLLCSSSLRKLSAGHNRLHKLPDRVERPLLEILDVQHNQLVELPSHLFLKSDR